MWCTREEPAVWLYASEGGGAHQKGKHVVGQSGPRAASHFGMPRIVVVLRKKGKLARLCCCPKMPDCSLKENRLIVLGPWQKRLSRKDGILRGAASLDVTSRTWFDNLLAFNVHNDIIQMSLIIVMLREHCDRNLKSQTMSVKKNGG